MKHKPELDALRFCAFLAVFMHHALPDSFMAGAFGVDLFFVLSSYLITTLLLREYAEHGTINIRAFYLRRALRIWPLYFAFLACVMLFLPSERMSIGYTLSYLAFVGNWAVAAWGYPSSVAALLWSVSIEEQFYVVWPALLAWFGVRRVPHLAIGALLIAWITRVVLVAAGVQHPGIWTNTLARLDPIACGALLAALLRGRSPQWTWLVRGAALVAFPVVAVLCHALDGPMSLITYPLIALAGTGVVAATLHDNARIPRVVVYLGKISYGLYVFHVLGLKIAYRIWPGVPHIVLGFGITLVLAAAAYHWLELPFLRIKARLSPPSRPPQ